MLGKLFDFPFDWIYFLVADVGEPAVEVAEDLIGTGSRQPDGIPEGIEDECVFM